MSATWEAAAKAWVDACLGACSGQSFVPGLNPVETFGKLFKLDPDTGLFRSPHLDAAATFKGFGNLLRDYSALHGGTSESPVELGPLVGRMVRELRLQAARNQLVDTEQSAQLTRWMDIFVQPILGPGRPTHQRWSVVTGAWQAHWSATQILRATHAAILDAALCRFATRVEDSTGEPITSLRGLFDEWVNCADAAYLDETRTSRFAVRFGDVVNSAIALRLAWTAWLTTTLNQFGVFDVGAKDSATDAAPPAPPQSTAPPVAEVPVASSTVTAGPKIRRKKNSAPKTRRPPPTRLTPAPNKRATPRASRFKAARQLGNEFDIGNFPSPGRKS
ncbi:MAG: hypothetical protein HYX63_09930 [Gammaproteobacteria bacterium]|nr:hypothetical protein [Gammaproteobacteria bacterium]